MLNLIQYYVNPHIYQKFCDLICPSKRLTMNMFLRMWNKSHGKITRPLHAGHDQAVRGS